MFRGDGNFRKRRNFDGGGPIPPEVSFAFREISPRPSDESGQSVVEFTLTTLLLMAFILFFVQITLVFGFANYVHYATFMSARAYLSAGPDKADQERRAKDVIMMTLKRGLGDGRDRFKSIGASVDEASAGSGVSGMAVETASGDPNLSWRTGVRYTFRSRLFMIPLGRGENLDPTTNSVELTSESWLLRETSAQECEQAMRRLGGMIDNGC